MNLFSWFQCALKGSCYSGGDRQCVSGVRSEQVHRHTQPTWPDLTWLCTPCWKRTSTKGWTKTKAALQIWDQATWGQFPSCTCCWRWWWWPWGWKRPMAQTTLLSEQLTSSTFFGPIALRTSTLVGGTTSCRWLNSLWSQCAQCSGLVKKTGQFRTGRENTSNFKRQLKQNHRTPGDQLEKGRGKFIHTVGAVGRVEWRTRGDHPFTGMFKVR